MDGIRKNFSKDFSKIYCFNLKGDGRTSGERCKQEGEPIFAAHGGSGGSLNGIAITILVKNKKSNNNCEIYYHDIGSYLSRKEKFKIIRDYKSVKNISWTSIQPNEAGDWINQRNQEFDNYLLIGSKDKDESNSIFRTYSRGVATSRDPWCYNFDRSLLIKNMNSMINFYNSEVKRISKILKLKNIDDLNNVVNTDSTKISWNRGLLKDLDNSREFSFEGSSVYKGIYRPFNKSNLYFNKNFNDMIYLQPRLFPTNEHKNLAICISGVGASKPFSAIATDLMPNLHTVDTGQCFPLYYYEHKNDVDQKSLPENSSEKPDNYGYFKRDAITDFALNEFRAKYEDIEINKEDLFYYIYGLLHSQEYKNRYQNDFKKMLPRIPLLRDFWNYSNTGRKLAELHINYESVRPFDLKEVLSENSPKKENSLYAVSEQGMRFGKNGKEEDRTTIIYNSFLTLSGIPLDAYSYQVNGKSAIEWIVERYCITVDLNVKGEGSGIKNNPNEWSDDPRYIVDLLKRIVTVSVETNQLVSQLPKFELL